MNPAGFKYKYGYGPFDEFGLYEWGCDRSGFDWRGIYKDGLDSYCYFEKGFDWNKYNKHGYDKDGLHQWVFTYEEGDEMYKKKMLLQEQEQSKKRKLEYASSTGAQRKDVMQSV